MSVACIDISYAQGGNIDFKKVKNSGVQSVIIRIGFGREVSQKDTYFERNYSGAKSVGLKVGGYWYSYASSTNDAKLEAQACLSCMAGKKFDLPIYYDMEENSQAASHTKSALTSMAQMFCNTIQAKGYVAGVYGNWNWFKNHLDYSKLRKAYSIWFAYPGASSPGLDCDIWQYTWTARIPGISNDVDGNKIYKTSFKGTGTASNVSFVTDVSDDSTVAIDPSSIDYTKLNSRVLILNRTSKNTDLSKANKHRISGVIIEAGCLYDTLHREKDYRSPLLDSQVKSASKNKISFGLYTDVKARSLSEASKEIDELRQCVQVYPPALGVWLHLQLSRSKSENNRIIDLYYKELVKMGLKGRIGFYATKSELSKIEWSKYYNDWYLLWNNHIKDLSEIETLLTPQFFVMD